jgi:prephenate dehydrogenase
VERIKNLAILGVGLLGGSIGLAVRSKLSDCRIVGYGHRKETLAKALEIGAIDEAFESPGEAVRGADLVILCTPVGILGKMIAAIEPQLKPDAIVTDVGSTKRSVVAAGGRLKRFVGSHPMAGSEKRGVEFARTDLFDQALCILTPTDTTDTAALAQVEAFWQALGMRVTQLSPDQHDRLLADVSHLPHAIAAALVAMQEDQALPLAGKGFLDATRIAGGDGALWRDILQDNRDSLKAALARLRGELEKLEAMLDPTHAKELADWLDQAAHRREALLQEKLREVTPD